MSADDPRTTRSAPALDRSGEDVERQRSLAKPEVTGPRGDARSVAEVDREVGPARSRSNARSVAEADRDAGPSGPRSTARSVAEVARDAGPSNPTTVAGADRPRGHAVRVVVALAISVVLALLACYVVLRIAVAQGFAEVLVAGEGNKVWLIVGVIGLVVGSSAYGFVVRVLERRARRAEERARVPPARLVE
jgi:hypothetical protein